MREVVVGFKVLDIHLVMSIFASKGRVNDVGARINGFNPWGVHAEPPVLPPPCCWMELLLHSVGIACKVL